MKSFTRQLKFYKTQVNLELAKYFELKILEAGKISPYCKKATRSLADYTLRGGKRVRALLFLYAYKAIAGKIDQQIIQASISMELIQSAFLIHDDIIDCDNLRRGGETIHYEYGKRDLHFGEVMAILIGDLAFNFAYETIINAKFKTSIKNEALKIFLPLVNKVNYGQILDMLPTSKGIDEKAVNLIQTHKTAAYTGQLPILTGAVLGGVSIKELKTLNLFAQKLGRAFQVQDDLEGTFGDPKETGKPANSDIREGKKTLLIVQALEKANKAEKKHIMGCLGNNKVSTKDIQIVRKIIYQTGSLQYSVDYAKRLIEGAIAVIKPAKIDSEAKEFLINLAKYILVKDKIIIPK